LGRRDSMSKFIPGIKLELSLPNGHISNRTRQHPVSGD
jgi:hypothetical protein